MDYVRFHARLHPTTPAVTDLTFDRHWTYATFDDLVARGASVLRARGVGEGDRVACLSKNRAEVVALHLACARVGAIFVPLSWRLSPPELETIVRDCEPTLIYGDEMAATLGIDADDVGGLLDACAGAAPAALPTPPRDLPSLMLYTSGTTGAPKGVLLSEHNLTETAVNSCLLLEVDRHSRFLCEAPMFHVIGMVSSVRPPLLVGAQIVISDRFLPERTFARLADPALGITHYFCVPQMALAIRAIEGFDPARLRGLKAVFTGGAPHPEAQIRAWLDDGIPIVDGYGSSEAGTVFGMPLAPALIASKAGSVGLPTPRLQARLVDDQDVPVATGVPGELQLKGGNVTVGYWRREEEHRAALTPDGWFRTGDVLTCDADGYYRVTDRKKDMYISGGENVYPVQVEAELVTYPGIRELAVVGVPDARWGEVGCLFYVPQAGVIDFEALQAFLVTKLAKYKVPKHVRVVEALPRNGVGKLLRHELRRRYQESDHAA
jgi:fatty-acyl-CoA synthase